MDDIRGKPNIETFSQYLFKTGVTKLSYKNYKSDLTNFGAWVSLKLRSFGIVVSTLSDSFPYINTKLANEYKSFLETNKTPLKTINRRLSTLRHLSRYLMANTILTSDFMQGVQNMSVYTPKKEKILRIKATCPFFSKNTVAAGTSGVFIELDKPLRDTSQINIWITSPTK